MKSLKTAFFCIVLVFLIPLTCFGWKGKVVGVADGDTITVLHHGRGEKIRLFGIDCPEKRQAFGRRAKQFTSSLVYKKRVEVRPVARDRYGRTVALVFVGKLSLNEELLRNGFAWVYTRYCRRDFCSRWRKLEEEARELRLGLWADKNSIAPWRYRHFKKYGYGASAYSVASLKDFASKAQQEVPVIFRGNARSKVFHRPGCKYYNCSGCSVEFRSREEALAAGFKPCRRCSP